MKTSKPFTPSASTQKASLTGLASVLPTKVQGRPSCPQVSSPQIKTYKKKQYTTSNNQHGTRQEDKKSLNQQNQSYRKTGNAGPAAHHHKANNSKGNTYANRKITEHVFKPKNVVDTGFEYMTAEESTESTSHSRHNSPSQKKYASLVVVKSPQKLETNQLRSSASNLGNLKAQNENQQQITNFTTILHEQHSNSNNVSDGNEDDNCSGYQSTDFQTAYENKSFCDHNCCDKTHKHGDCNSDHQVAEASSQFDPKKLNNLMANAEESRDVHSLNSSRRGSFSITTASETANHDEQINHINSTIIDSEVVSVSNDTDSNPVAQSVQPVAVQQNTAQMGKFKVNATPFFFPKEKLNAPKKQTIEKTADASLTLSIEQQNEQQQKASQSKGALASSLMNSGLDSLTLDNEFTPSTPYVHKFRTELCKNFQLYGKCKWGDECSFAHGKTHMMVKTDVSVLYKTKLCKKFSANGWCPYGMRCQFIHEVSDNNKPVVQQPQITKPAVVELKYVAMPSLKLNAIQNAPINQSESDKGASTAESSPKDKPTLSVANVKAFVPTVKIIAEEKKSEPIADKSKDIQESKTVIPSTQVVAIVKKVLNPGSIAFVPTKVVLAQTISNASGLRTPFADIPKSYMPATHVGGFGNKQTSVALASEKIIYNEVLVHCVKMSIQEYQKKLKMFNKKVKDKKKYLDVVEPPTIQYHNIYSKGTVNRLSCFKRITECSAAFLNVKEDDDNEGGYFYGDATSYEKHLDAQLQRLDKAVKSGHYQPKIQKPTYNIAHVNEQQMMSQQYNNNMQQMPQVDNSYSNHILQNYLSFKSVGNMSYKPLAGGPVPQFLPSYPQQQQIPAQNQFYYC